MWPQAPLCKLRHRNQEDGPAQKFLLLISPFDLACFCRQVNTGVVSASTFHCLIKDSPDGDLNVGNVPQPAFNSTIYNGAVYNPFAERQTLIFASAAPIRVIKAGEELVDEGR